MQGGEKLNEKKIKVTDKRMFTPDGELREEFRASIEDKDSPDPGTDRVVPSEGTSEPVAETSSSGQIAREATGADPEPTARVEIPDLGPAASKPEFADLVAVLAQPIAMYLGDMPLPNGESAENLEAARLYIDMLEILRDKTLGNLSAQEMSLIDDLLYQIRLRYVQKRG